ncbi:MAG: OprD family outer membrane porin [Sulfurimonas sp.]|jgi:hypothetical protein
MTKLSVVTALLLGSGVLASAADDLASAFKEGKLDGRIRAQYFNTDWDDNSVKGKNGSDANGLAIGGSLIYKTAPLYGISAGTGLYTTQNPAGWTEANDGATSTTSKDLFSRDTGQPYGEGYAVLAEAYLQVDIAKTKGKGGHFLMNNPWITPNDTKMIPISVEGYEGISNDIANTTIQLDYADKLKERGMTYFGNMTDTGDTPLKIKNYYSGGTHGDAPSVIVAGIKNKSINGLELQVWGMNWNNLANQALVEANYALEAGDVIFGFGARYIRQYDKGAGAILAPKTTNGDNDNSIDSSLWAFRTTADYRAVKLLLSLSQTNKNGDMIAPWRGFLTQGYTRSMTVTDWNANTKGYKAQIDYDFNTIVSGLSTSISYSYYNRDPSKTPYASATDRLFGNGDTRQTNLDIVYKLAGSFKGTELKARFMDQNNDLDGTKEDGTSMINTSNKEMRLEANYRF